MIAAWLTGVAVWGPGLPGWAASRAVLAGQAPYLPADTPPPAPDILSSTERRRTGVSVRLALAVAQQAMAMCGEPPGSIAPGSIASVFGSANGDGAVVNSILVALTGPERVVSPTQFHNSVHNAAAGYWTIATGSHLAATSLGCHDSTFAAALLKAATQLRVEQAPVLLVLYDATLPEPLLGGRPPGAPFAAALVLSPQPSPRALARIGVAFHPAPPAPDREAPLLEGLRDLAKTNPAARSLRLLEQLARGQPATLSARLLDARIDIELQPCPTQT